eukprot:Protomagalhaensia_wolfi_Nauph_80__494@NODE_1278_length_1614_cov_701_004444_g985_i0_p1_GENE_NODE_1278_length_1614_cov_701_004444_g985_i0NODE_1278_length_1614_cov_701_004444_g985_i0_p1_ORF_typecomplete_len157_score9_98_NODE_1278_length_1614_cov_701_004444_g985_i055471
MIYLFREVAKFLNAAQRYRFAQLCRTTRLMIYSGDFEIEAMMEYLRMGAPEFPVDTHPLKETSSSVTQISREVLWESLTSWHSVMARMQFCGFNSQWDDNSLEILVTSCSDSCWERWIRYDELVLCSETDAWEESMNP